MTADPVADNLERLRRYVLDTWKASGCTAWPQVAAAADALRLSQKLILEIANSDHRFMLTSLLADPPIPDKEHYIELLDDDVERCFAAVIA